MGFYDYAIEDAALKNPDSVFLKLENDYPRIRAQIVSNNDGALKKAN